MSATPYNGAEALAQAFEDAGVTHVFGMPGSQNALLFSAFAQTRLRTVLAGSELMAAFMANGFHRAGGGVPVVATIPGPGFTYALTGFAEAAQDNAAMVLVTGEPDHWPGKRFALQAIDQAGMVEGLARARLRLDRSGDAASVATAALSATVDQGPGPVLVEIAQGVLSAPAEGSGNAPPEDEARAPDAPDCAEIAERLAEARRVVIVAGQGAVPAAPALRQLVERRPAMVLTTVSARGVLPESHHWSLAHDYLACSVDETNALLEQADLVLVLGCRTSHNGTGGFALALPEDRTAQVDLDPEVLGANYAPRWSLRADVTVVLEGLLTALDNENPKSDWSVEDVAFWRRRLRERCAPAPAEPRFPGVEHGAARAFFDALRAALPTDAVVVTDTGQHQVMTRRHWRVDTPGGLLAPSDYQSMGFGVPAAIGAALAAPERRTVAVVGDGGLMMSGLELATAVREGLDLTVIVFRDGHLGQIRSQQASSGTGEAAVALAGVDLASLAKATGAQYRRVGDDARSLLEAACRADGVTLVDVPLAESREMRQERLLGSARGAARRALGRRGVAFLRRVLQRG